MNTAAMTPLEDQIQRMVDRQAAARDARDAEALVVAVPRRGGAAVWKVVRVPSIADEDRRQLHLDLLTRTRDRTRVLKRMTGLLAGCGVRLARPGDVEAQLNQAHQSDG
jgi:transposase